MFRIDNSTAAVALPTPAAIGPKPNGYFTKGDPVGGVPATVVDDDWANALQEELIAVVVAGALTPSKTVRTQVRDAIQAMISGSLTPAASAQGAFKNLAIVTTGGGIGVSVTADELVVEDLSNNYRTLRSINTNLLTTNFSAGVPLANGVDTGVAAVNSTWYSVWVIWGSVPGTAGLLSLSATAPSMPTGYTHKSRVGWVRIDASGNKYPLSMHQYGRNAQYKVAAGTNIAALPIIASGVAGATTTPTWVSIALGSYIPPSASRVRGQLIMNSASHAIAAPNNAYGAQASSTNSPPVSVNSTASGFAYPIDFILESTSVYWASDSAANYIQCLGWEDNL